MSVSEEGEPGWASSPKRTSLAVNGKLIRELRKARRLTQEQLAELAGYSVRLIRKAEAGKTLKADTIEVLAETLSTSTTPVSPETLASDPLAMVRTFCTSYAQDEAQMAARVESILSPNMVYKMAGDPQVIPFAGVYHGVEGLDQWAHKYYSTLERPYKDIYQPKLYQAGTSVLAIGHEAVLMPGIDEVLYSVTVVRFDFERGKIVMGDNDYDTDGAMAYLERHQAKIDGEDVNGSDVSPD